jgi:lipoprotein NlpD
LGQEIRAVTKGKIIYAGEDLKGYGKLVILKHDDGILTVYGSQNEILVTENQIVNAGQTIGIMGNSATEQVKLIFEVRDGGKSIDPLKYLKKFY